jgi:hypothetical protein
MHIEKRGLTLGQAMEYIGVKRRTFDSQWRPRLVAIPQGVILLFDRQEIDRLFDEFKLQASGDPAAANDAGELAHNGPRNGRPINQKGDKAWANQREGFTPPKTDPGKLTDGGAALDFASVASRVLQRRKGG